MAIASALCQGIDNFVECSIAVRIAFFLIPVAVVLQAFGVGTAAWSNSDSSRQGLWTYCYDEREFSCCESIYDKTEDTPGLYVIVFTQFYQLFILKLHLFFKKHISLLGTSYLFQQV